MLISSSLDQETSASLKGFSLPELIASLAILSLLSFLCLRTIDGMMQRSKRAQVHVDLAYISMGLERYKEFHGGYPVAVNESMGSRANVLLDSLAGEVDEFSHLDIDRLRVDENTGVILDPYGNPYCYGFDLGWRQKSFFLCSAGRDGQVIFDFENGSYRSDLLVNVDNVEGCF